jgi:tripeptidyl-peptidase-1
LSHFNSSGSNRLLFGQSSVPEVRTRSAASEHDAYGSPHGSETKESGLSARMLFPYVTLLVISLVANGNSDNGKHMVKETLKWKSRKDIVKGPRADPDKNHTVVFARAQGGINELTTLLLDVSEPSSGSYGFHLTRKEVVAFTAQAEATAAIINYLSEYGLAHIETSKYGDFVKAEAPVSTWEKLFAAEFYEFSHAIDPLSKKFVRCLRYSLPSDLHRHVHAVFNTAQLPAFVPSEPAAITAAVPHVGFTTPSVLRDVYNIDSNKGNNLTSQAIYGNLYQSLSPSDLSRFQAAFALPQQPIAAAPGGHVSDTACNDNINDCIEANLDAQYMISTAQDVPTTYYYWSGDDVWLDWIMTVADMDDPPDVYSISYGSYEFFMSLAYLDAFNVEAIKLGVMGTTILASSGDDGVAGFLARNFGPSFCDYYPMFPASSPFVTAVGGTMVPLPYDHWNFFF